MCGRKIFRRLQLWRATTKAHHMVAFILESRMSGIIKYREGISRKDINSRRVKHFLRTVKSEVNPWLCPSHPKVPFHLKKAGWAEAVWGPVVGCWETTGTFHYRQTLWLLKASKANIAFLLKSGKTQAFPTPAPARFPNVPSRSF